VNPGSRKVLKDFRKRQVIVLFKKGCVAGISGGNFVKELGCSQKKNYFLKNVIKFP